MIQSNRFCFDHWDYKKQNIIFNENSKTHSNESRLDFKIISDQQLLKVKQKVFLFDWHTT